MQKNGENIFNFSPDGIQKQLEGSLQRLKTNFIDIYLLHIPDNLLDVSSILSTLNSLKKQGIIKKYGLCNTYAEQLQAFLKHPLSEIEYIEDFYNIIERKAEKSIFPYLKKEISFIAYGSLYR